MTLVRPEFAAATIAATSENVDPTQLKPLIKRFDMAIALPVLVSEPALSDIIPFLSREIDARSDLRARLFSRLGLGVLSDYSGSNLQLLRVLSSSKNLKRSLCKFLAEDKFRIPWLPDLDFRDLAERPDYLRYPPSLIQAAYPEASTSQSTLSLSPYHSSGHVVMRPYSVTVLCGMFSVLLLHATGQLSTAACADRMQRHGSVRFLESATLVRNSADPDLCDLAQVGLHGWLFRETPCLLRQTV